MQASNHCWAFCIERIQISAYAAPKLGHAWTTICMRKRITATGSHATTCAISPGRRRRRIFPAQAGNLLNLTDAMQLHTVNENCSSSTDPAPSRPSYKLYPTPQTSAWSLHTSKVCGLKHNPFTLQNRLLLMSFYCVPVVTRQNHHKTLVQNLPIPANRPSN